MNASVASLLAVAARGQTDELTRLLERGEAMEATDSNGNTPLMVAVNSGHAEAVGVLLKHGANPNMKNYRGETALMLAAAAGEVAVTTCLIEAGADAKLKNWWGETAEAIARKNDRQELAELLCKEGSKITYGPQSRVGDMVEQARNYLVPTAGTKCWFCDKATREPGADLLVTLFASMADHGGGPGEWSRLTVAVPMCKRCKKPDNRLAFVLFLAAFTSFGVALWCGEKDNNWAFGVFFLLGFVLGPAAAGFITTDERHLRSSRGRFAKFEYPLVAALRRNGWSVGDKPPEVARPAPAGGQSASVASSVPAESSPDATQPPATMASPSVPAPASSASADFDRLVAKLRVRGPNRSITEESIDATKALGDLGDERAVPILKTMGREALEGCTEPFAPSGGVRVLSGDAVTSLAMQFVNAATLAIQKIEKGRSGALAAAAGEARPNQAYDLSAYDSPQSIIEQCKVCESRDDYSQMVALLQKLLAEFSHDVVVHAVQDKLVSALAKVGRWSELRTICTEILRAHRQVGFPIKDHDKMYFLLLSEHRGNKPEALDHFVKLSEDEAVALVNR